MPGLHTAWQSTEELRQWDATATRENAEARLDQWVGRVRTSGPEEQRTALSAFSNGKPDMLAFFRFLPTRISHGSVEGKQNRTKTIMRQASGYRTVRHLRVRIVMERGG